MIYNQYELGDITVYSCDDFGLLVKPQDLDLLSQERIREVATWCREHEKEALAIPVMERISSHAHGMLSQVADWIVSACANGDLASDEIRLLARNELERRENGHFIDLLPLTPAKRECKAPRSGFVYLAYSETGHYKIGKSSGPKRRIKVFNTKMPVAVTLVHVFCADDMSKAESSLHERYVASRVKGEWFDLSDIDVKAIKSILEFDNNSFVIK